MGALYGYGRFSSGSRTARGSTELQAVALALRAPEFEIILRTVGFDTPEWADF